MNSGRSKNNNSFKTVLTIVVGFVLVFLITKWKWSLNVAFFVGLAGILSSFLAKQIDFVWMKLAQLLGYIVPNVLLTLLFFLFLFPVAVLSRTFGKKDALNLKNNKQSLFKESKTVINKTYFEKPW